METWEIVLVLVLVTISSTILVNQNVSLSLIQLLDNSLFQLVIVGLTLGVAVVSPSVAIVAIATIVIVYYVRNLIKVQMINNNLIEENSAQGNQGNGSPRMRVEETTTTTVETTMERHIEIGDEAGCSAQTKPEDIDVVEAALNEDSSRVAVTAAQMQPQNFKIKAAAPVFASKPLDQEDFPNPRSPEGFQVDSTDPLVETRGQAPQAGTPSYIASGKNTFADDANIFTPGAAVPEGYNEGTAKPVARAYNQAEGQYGIAAPRPFSGVQKRELADFVPGKEIGSNEYSQHGVSIDDKMTNLMNGIQVSSKPPPNFDAAAPVQASLPMH